MVKKTQNSVSYITVTAKPYPCIPGRIFVKAMAFTFGFFQSHQVNLADATSRRRCHKNVAGSEGESKTCTMLTMVFFFAAANWVPCCKRL